MSLVRRAMIQPARCSEKYRSESVVRCPNRCGAAPARCPGRAAPARARCAPSTQRRRRWRRRRRRRPQPRSSPARMPLSTASLTSSQPPAWAAAPPVAASTTSTNPPPALDVRASRSSPARCLSRTSTPRRRTGGERAAGREQLGGRALLDDPPPRQHDGAVGRLDGREALRRDQHRATGDGRPQAREQRPLGLGVDGRQRVVQHEHAGVGEQHAGQGDPLALAAREVDAALADQGVVAVRQLVDEGATPAASQASRTSSSSRRAGRRGGSRAAGPRTGRPAG